MHFSNENRLVCILPVTPVENPPFERFFSPLAAYAIARLLKSKLQLLVNLTGLRIAERYKDPVAGRHLFWNQWSLFLDQVVTESYVIDDQDLGYAEFVHQQFGSIPSFKEAFGDIAGCLCGKSEMFAELVGGAVRSSRTQIRYESGVYSCRSCGQELKKARRHILQLRPVSTAIPVVLPRRYQTEVIMMLQTLRGRNTLLSRSFRQEETETKVEEYIIDPDVWWSLLPVWVARKVDTVVIVVAYPALWHAVRAYLLMAEMSPAPKVEFVIHPRVGIVDCLTPLKGRPLTEYIDMAGSPIVARLFPFLGLRWNNSHTFLKGSELYLAQHSCKPLHPITEQDSLPLSSVLDVLNRDTLLKLLKGRRSRYDVVSPTGLFLEEALHCNW